MGLLANVANTALLQADDLSRLLIIIFLIIGIIVVALVAIIVIIYAIGYGDFFTSFIAFFWVLPQLAQILSHLVAALLDALSDN